MKSTKLTRSALLGLLAVGLSVRPAAAEPPKKEVATLAAGCFWSMEAIFKQLRGVSKVEPGYSGGTVANPSYEQVEAKRTGHAETVDVTFDPSVISYRTLLDVLLTVRDPTSKDRQGNDEGPEYRSVIFYRSDAQKRTATDEIAKFSRVWKAPIVTEVVPFKKFWRAESYHFDYYRLHPSEPYCSGVIAPEITEFRTKFKSLLKK